MPTLRVSGLRELHSALKRYDNELKKELERELREAAKIVSVEAAGLFGGVSARAAAGFRPRVRGFGRVAVEQRLGRTTGQRPDFGSLQMRTALLPALEAKQDEVVNHIEGMLDRLGRKEGFS